MQKFSLPLIAIFKKWDLAWKKKMPRVKSGAHSPAVKQLEGLFPGPSRK